MLSWDDAKTPTAVVGSLLGILGVIAGYVYAAKKWLWSRPRVKRIVRSSDGDLEKIWQIHEAEFVGDVADEFKDFQRWLAEAAEARKKRPLKFDEFLLCVKSNDSVFGYLFAQYYAASELIFVSYIAINEKLDDAKKKDTKVVSMLFNELLKQLSKQQYQWRGIIGEFEEFKAGSFVPHAKLLMRTFQSALTRFQSQYRLHTDLYRICIDYKQPVLRPQELDTAVIDTSYDQWLVFVPREPEKILLPKEAGRTFVERSVVLEIIRSVYFEVYFDAFQQDERYKNYLRTEFNKLADKLPEKIELASDFRAHLPNEKDAKKSKYQSTIGFEAMRPSTASGC